MQLKQLRITILSLLASLVLRGLYRTIRWQSPLFTEKMPEGWLEGSSKIFLFWHAHQLMMPWFFLTERKDAHTRLAVLISRHADGRIISEAVRRLDIDSVAGSSSRGASGASKELVTLLKKGDHIAITPDGPRGPANEVKLGVVKLAQLSGASIYPATYQCSSFWRVKSWDRMIIPRPFSRGVFALGREIRVPKKLESEQDYEHYRKEIGAAINQVNELAQRQLFG